MQRKELKREKEGSGGAVCGRGDYKGRIGEDFEENGKHKSPGGDGIPIELLNKRGERLEDVFLEFIFINWRKIMVPKDREKSIILPVYKSKGNKENFKNYR